MYALMFNGNSIAAALFVDQINIYLEIIIFETNVWVRNGGMTMNSTQYVTRGHQTFQFPKLILFYLQIIKSKREIGFQFCERREEQ